MEKYKPSGIDWLGNIPAEWEVIKTSYVFHKIGSGTTPESSNTRYYDVAGIPFLQTGDLNDGIVSDTATKITKYALENCRLKIYTKGSLVIALYGATIGKLGILDLDTTVNQAACVLSQSKKMLTRFAFYTFLACKKSLLLESKGGGQPNISQETIRRWRIPVPPLDEQKAIAEYLDEKCDAIDRAVTAGKELVECLKERKQILITRAVTRGVRKSKNSRPLKNSGIDWLGNIPSEWEVKRIKPFIKRSFAGVWGFDPTANNQNTSCIRIADFDYDCGILKKREFTKRFIPQKDLDKKLLKKGDLLIEKSGGGDLFPVGRVVRYTLDEIATCSNFIHTISVNENLFSDFLYYVFRMIYAKKVNSLYYNQTTGIQNLQVSEYLNQEIPVPPLAEQKEIAEYLDEKCGAIDRAVEMQLKEIELLQERKQILINEVVTGKRRVV